MYKFLVTYSNKAIANLLMGLWYLFLIIVNIYCSVSAATQGAFQYVGW
jgi:hypothetical protein